MTAQPRYSWADGVVKKDGEVFCQCWAGKTESAEARAFEVALALAEMQGRRTNPCATLIPPIGAPSESFPTPGEHGSPEPASQSSVQPQDQSEPKEKA